MEKINAHQVMNMIEGAKNIDEIYNIWRSGVLIQTRGAGDDGALMRAFVVRVGQITGRHWSDIVCYGLRGV